MSQPNLLELEAPIKICGALRGMPVLLAVPCLLPARPRSLRHCCCCCCCSCCECRHQDG